jgi:hypothetical protein
MVVRTAVQRKLPDYRGNRGGATPAERRCIEGADRALAGDPDRRPMLNDQPVRRKVTARLRA